MLDELWTALGGNAADARDVEIAHGGRHLPAAFDVDALAAGAVRCALLVQALDHATGYLLAAAVLRELAGERRNVRLALAATAALLMRHPASDGGGAPPVCDGFRVEL